MDDLWNSVVCYQTPNLLIGKVKGTSDALLCISYTLQSTLESGHEARIVQIGFSVTFDRVNRYCILHKLCLWVLEVLHCLY